MMKPNYLISVIAVFISTACLAGASDTKGISPWKTECVGRFQISTPGEMAIILTLPFDGSRNAKMAKYIANSSMRSVPDSYSFSHYKYEGDIGITPAVPIIDFENLRNVIKPDLIAEKKKLLDEAINDEKYGYLSLAQGRRERAATLKPMDYDTPTMFGWHDLYYQYINNRIMIYGGIPHSDDEEVNKQIAKQVNAVLNDFRPRALYEIPTQPGVCIPFGFIPDDGKAIRDIAVTLVLVDHPEVEVIFQDTSYTLYRNKHPDSDTDIVQFLEDYARDQKFVKTDFWGSHFVNIGGQDGRGLFFTIARLDGNTDYGYIAAARGGFSTGIEPSNTTQLLFITRTASLAKGEPISQDKFKAMAKKIAASIKRNTEK